MNVAAVAGRAAILATPSLLAALNGRREQILSALPPLARALMRAHWDLIEAEVPGLAEAAMTGLLTELGPRTLEEVIVFLLEPS